MCRAVALTILMALSAFGFDFEKIEAEADKNGIAMYADTGAAKYLKVASQQDFPENTVSSINIGSMDGKTRLIGIYPVSESGDWDFGTVSFFDEAGTLVGYKVILDYFNSMCTDGSLHTVKVYEKQGAKFILIRKTVEDENGKDLSKKDCANPYAGFKPEIIRDLQAYLKRIESRKP
jgi:hypothetical protein